MKNFVCLRVMIALNKVTTLQKKKNNKITKFH